MKAVLFFFLFISVSVFSQSKPITFKASEENNKLVFICTNNSKTSYDVTLTLTKKKGLAGYTRPITKKVAPETNLVFASLSIKGSYSYSYSTSYKKSKKTKKELQDIAQKKKEAVLKDLAKINTGIVVFDKSDCPRCQRSTAYLLDNNIKFKLLDVSSNNENNRLMWSLLRAEGVTKEILTPVFLVDGKLSYSHEDLNGFLKSLK
ncbi:conjugal transfer protein TraF [Dokdonia sp.]|uniref:glutaredoxin family protein n=1 Tax=Dokdonia sp. TaxID=2024995 RepID=UPI0032639443